ncbi:hypothetical protein BC833DRAFT_610672 [Globomyces pollinis-pini]|nr:hypothetical protein BC833DRAFT_610672 [Globomyces pollinis-pini]
MNTSERYPFMVVAAGFSTSLLLNQFCYITEGKSASFLILSLLSWLFFLIIQTIYAIQEINNLPKIVNPILLGIGTILYSIVLCTIFYISLLRLRMVTFQKRKSQLILRFGIGFMVIIFSTRSYRTVMIVMGDLSTFASFKLNLIHFLSCFPLMFFRVVLDILALKGIWVHLVKNTKSKVKKANFQRLLYSFVFELILNILTVLMMLLVAMNCIDFRFVAFDWILVAWALRYCLETNRILNILVEGEVQSFGNSTKK